MKQKLKTLDVLTLTMKAHSDPTPVMHTDDTESVASASVKTRDLWNWHLPEVNFQVTIPGWVILLGAALFFHGPKEC